MALLSAGSGRDHGDRVRLLEVTRTSRSIVRAPTDEDPREASLATILDGDGDGEAAVAEPSGRASLRTAVAATGLLLVGFIVSGASASFWRRALPGRAYSSLVHADVASSEALWVGGAQCSWLSNDNCKNEDTFACHCREMNPTGPCTPCPGSHLRDEGAGGDDQGEDEPAATTPEPTPPPTPPPAHFSERKGSFLVIGDWGWDDACHGNVETVKCQSTIAQLMLLKFKELGDVKFIINVGDSFYAQGVKNKDDGQWQTKWRDVYPAELRSVPWYTVYGNHDLHQDPCMCSDDITQCAQVNDDASQLRYFYMPDVNWHKEHPELDLEVVGLDLNRFMGGWNTSRTLEELKFDDCQWTPCKETCFDRSKRRGEEAFTLFRQRIVNSKTKNMLVFSHYPTDYFTTVNWFLEALRDNKKRDILYVAGHRHSTDDNSGLPITPNKQWLVGGGGGWSCDGPDQGFLVGEISKDSTLYTYPVLVDKAVCCPEPRDPARRLRSAAPKSPLRK